MDPRSHLMSPGKMNRKQFLTLMAAGLAAPAFASAAPAPRRPNVLVILTDDMRWDAIGAVQREQGGQALFPWFKTPNMDRLAAEGARFANAFVTTSLCSPSRATLLSGQYAHRHKVLNNFTDYPQRPPWLSAPPQGGRLRDGLHRQVHMGEDDDRQRPGLRLLDEPQGPGQLFRQRVQRQRPAQGLQGLLHHRRHRRRRAVARPARTRSRG